jgi:sugar phosphate isomerase/epimerase
VLILCYNTNGFYHHTLEDATRIVADLGYKGIALTPDVHHLNPLESKPADVDRYRALVERLGLSLVIETGARFILDKEKKHHPSLFTPGGERLQFLETCVDLADRLGAELVSFHSGCAAGDDGLETLAAQVNELLVYAQEKRMPLALEPEPGMFIESMQDFDRLAEKCGEHLMLTLDVGHVHITEKAPIEDVIRANSRRLVNVHLDDAAGGVHEHLPLGEGEIDFQPVMEALEALNRPIHLSVELSRHGHEAVRQARKSYDYLADRR